MKIQITPMNDFVIRIRASMQEDFAQSPMERYGIICEDWLSDTEKGSCIRYEQSGEQIHITCKEISLTLSLQKANGYGCTLTVGEQEKFYGLGYRQEDRIELRGSSFRNHVAYGANYGPNPFLMSDSGWGIFYNTTFDTYFDVCDTKKDRVALWSKKGEWDYFVMFGDLPKLIDSFTQLTGRVKLMPLWGYGFMFICNEKENQFDVLNHARTFLQDKLPLDMIGLEPSWMKQRYDTSTNSDWDEEKFYMPRWGDDLKQCRKYSFCSALERHDIHTSLWLACDYDIYEEAERKAGIKKEDALGWIDPSKFDFDTKLHQPIHMDQVTVKGEGWFEHLKKFVDIGVSAFKQDPAFVINDHPDRLYANGMTDEEAHNLYSSVLAKQFHEAYAEYTGGLRPMHFLGTSYTGTQAWAPTWTCDCGGTERALLGILQQSLCGHSNITCDMDIFSPQGIHFGFLQPWSQLNSWIFTNYPWWLSDKDYEIFRFYAGLHADLVPYVYSYTHKARQCGIPVVRAMPIQFQDRNMPECTRQYMLGADLLVGCFTEKVYLPEGRWTNLWNGECLEGGREVSVAIPENRGGQLFAREGAIIAKWDGTVNAATFAKRKINFSIYPAARSEFTLCRDDGITEKYIDGAYSEMTVSCERSKTKITVTVSAQRGSYDGMEQKSSYGFKVHCQRPQSVTGVGAWDYQDGCLLFDAQIAAEESKLFVIK